jgi:Ankyrin repeat
MLCNRNRARMDSSGLDGQPIGLSKLRDARRRLGAVAPARHADPREDPTMGRVAQGAYRSLHHSSKECIELLLRHGANANAPDRHGNSPLALARHNKNSALYVPLLEKYGAKGMR